VVLRQGAPTKVKGEEMTEGAREKEKPTSLLWGGTGMGHVQKCSWGESSTKKESTEEKPKENEPRRGTLNQKKGIKIAIWLRCGGRQRKKW